MTRIEPLLPAEWPEAMGEALAALTPSEPRHPFPPRSPGRPKGLNLLGTFARHPALTRAFHTFTGHVLFATTLSPRQRELLVLRVASVRAGAYEYAQHLVIAHEVGLTPEEVERITVGPADPAWDPLDRALLSAVDELLTDARIGDATWAALTAELDEQQCMDVVFTVGAYEVLAMAVRTFDVELDADLLEWKRPSP